MKSKSSALIPNFKRGVLTWFWVLTYLGYVSKNTLTTLNSKLLGSEARNRVFFEISGWQITFSNKAGPRKVQLKLKSFWVLTSFISHCVCWSKFIISVSSLLFTFFSSAQWKGNLSNLCNYHHPSMLLLWRQTKYSFKQTMFSWNWSFFYIGL